MSFTQPAGQHEPETRTPQFSPPRQPGDLTSGPNGGKRQSYFYPSLSLYHHLSLFLILVNQ